jgi:hypothetical protein
VVKPHSVAHVAMKDMENIRGGPLHPTMGVPVASAVVALAGGVVAAQKQQAPLTTGLVN